MDRSCPFCEIAPSRLTHADDLAIAIRDDYPVSPGHTLVLPRRHVETFFDLDPAEQRASWALVEAVRRDLDAQLRPRPDGYNVGFNAGCAAGQTVMHAHIHVIPRYVGDMADPRGGVRGVIPSAQKYGPDAAGVAARPRLVAGGREDPLVRQILPALDGAVLVDLALAFLFDAGVERLHDRLLDVLRRPGAQVRVLTGDYQDVTEPAALRHLLQLSEIARASADPPREDSPLRLKVYRVGARPGDSFHPKAWIVRGSGLELAWVGSSNLSRSALETGVEWNYQIAAACEIAGVRRAFDELWAHPQAREVDEDWIAAYASRRVAPARGGAPLAVAVAEDAPLPRIEPRPGVQSEALVKLQQTRAEGNKAGLVVLATGLGKTYLSAFDSRASEFRRVLFIAHREEILAQALETFRRVRPEARLGFYTGKQKDAAADILFASIQTLSAEHHLESFAPDRFDYIVVDEFHHASAATYRRVIDYFEPKFLLGLTATPDRTDGASLLTHCEGNEVFRAGIPRGIAEKQLAPFRYFGIKDPSKYGHIPWRSYTDDALGNLVSNDDRAQRALDALDEHTTGRVRALGFCVTKAHADFMTEYFAARGRACVAVYSGSAAPRTASLERLARGELEIVFCVDMFNEGVDVPSLDTLLMLRPTDSAILWLQQLGRGLRWIEGKTLTVLDFIGNHAVFLRRPEILLRALDPEVELGTRPWLQASRHATLPPGVTIKYDLEAQDVLEQLRAEAARTRNKEVRWYDAFHENTGERPTALEAERAGYFKKLSDRGGGWFGYIAARGHLDPDESAAVDALRAFFLELETLQHTRSYKMLVLQAALHLEPFPGRCRKRAIAEWIAVRARRSATLMRDLSEDGRDPAAIQRLLHTDAFPRLVNVGAGAFLRQTPNELDTSALAVAPTEAVRRLTLELVERLLTTYLDKADQKLRSSSMKLPKILGDDGKEVDARFDVEDDGNRRTIVFHSGGDSKKGEGTTRNSQYSRGLSILLQRLGRHGIQIARIEADTATTKKKGLSLEERTVRILGHDYPIDVAMMGDHSQLVGKIGRAAKKVGQAPDAKGGNDQKRLRITPVQNVPAGELWRMLHRG